MKKVIKKLLTTVLSLSVLVTSSASLLPAYAVDADSSVSADEEKTVTVALGSDAYTNYSLISSAIRQADSSRKLTVKLQKAGTFKVASSGAAIMLRSNTVLDLNGATLVRSGSMLNMFQNEDFSGNRSNGGYNQTYSFGIKNGTLDGSGGSAEEVNLVNLGHATGISIENVNFKNCRSGHLIELTGCRDSKILGCTFTGFIGASTGDNEAIQLDICNNSVAGSWNGVYYSDNSVCKNITVDNCVFNDYPAGVGNHHTIYGLHNSEIKITNNKFLNTANTDGVAIWCYGFDNSTVSGNVISGKYSTGIMVSGGSVAVEGNTVSNTAYNPLYITKATSYTLGKKNVRTDENASSCKVKNNTLAAKGAYIALSIFSGSGVSEISGNTISSTGESAIVCSGAGTKVGNVKSNKITSTAGYGILAASSSSITSVSANTISGKTEGIQISSGGYIKEISYNTGVTSSGGNGILISGASAGDIIGNTIKSCNENGIFVSSSGTVSKVQANTISGCGEYALRINNSGITVAVGQNKYSSNGYGGEKINARTTTPPAIVNTNLDTPVLKSAACVYNGIKFSWNAVSGAAKYRVFYKVADGGWTKAGDTASTSFTHTGLTSGTAYTYTARCISADAKTYTSSYNTKGVSAKYVAAPSLSISCVSNGLKLGWSAVNGAAKYRVYYKNSSGGWSKATDTASTSYTYTAVSPGKSCTFTIKCLDSKSGSVSGYNPTGWSAVYVAPPVLSSTQNTASGVTVKWKASSGAAKYRVFLKTASGWSKLGDASGTSYTHTSAASGSTYTYTVRCLNSKGSYCSAYDANGISATFIGVPKISSASSTQSGIKLNWGAVKGAAKYRVFYKNSNGGWSKAGDTASTSFTYTNVSAGSSYTFTVRCTNSAGSSYTSAYNTSGTTVKYYPAPVLVGATSTQSGVKLTWNAVKGASNYRVFYKNSNGGWSKLADVSSTSYIHKAAANGKAYTYTVRCLNSGGTAYTSSYNSSGITCTYKKPASTQTVSSTVYWLDSGKVYHADINCYHIRGKSNIHSGTNPPAGRTLCKDCG